MKFSMTRKENGDFIKQVKARLHGKASIAIIAYFLYHDPRQFTH